MGEANDSLVSAVAPVLAAAGLDLYDLELVGKGAGRTLRVTIDRDGGIDLDAITRATEAVSAVLDHDPSVAPLLTGAYTLEVTSPGLERSLRTPAHFRRAVGSTVSVKTGAGQTATRRRGTLVGADDTGFELRLDDGSTERTTYDEVVQARTVFEWGNETSGRARKQQKVAS